MKSKNGFVSNSSTASFVVRFKDRAEDYNKLSDEQINKLKEFGFINSFAYFPCQVQICGKDPEGDSFTYDTSCNEDIPIEFLIENKIQFMADLHYDQYSIDYDGDSKVRIFANYGKLSQMSRSIINDMDRINPFVEVDSDEFLSSGCAYQLLLRKECGWKTQS